MAYWLLKTEPEDFSYQDLEAKGKEPWNGVKSPSALKHMGEIRIGDGLFIYHTGKVKAIVGVGKALTGAYPDPTAGDARLLVFDVAPFYGLTKPVTLSEIKSEPSLAEWELARQPRLSVMPVTEEQWRWVHARAETMPGL